MKDYKSDIEIARSSKMEHIREIAKKIGLEEDDIEYYGKYKAKIDLSVISKFADKKRGKLILTTAITPTPAGEGKSTTTVGLGQALNRLGKNCVIALREPSLGPCFGIKGGAAGGGYSQVVPMEDINLHFTGDIHAIGTAHNLLSAAIDNHIKHGNNLNFDLDNITWKRVMDMNDRALREIIIGRGGKANGIPREDGFMITVASEVMAIMCLSESIYDMKERFAKIVVGYNTKGEAIKAESLNVYGAMAAVMKEAIKPNLVQTLENTPAIIHGGPFANIAHGCNSLVATEMALKLSDYVVTEAGFGADLGAEKFFDIKCRFGKLIPDCVVLVATALALKMQGGVKKEDLKEENLEAVEKGLPNLMKHIENIKKYNLPLVVTLNKIDQSTPKELELIKKACEKEGVECVYSHVWGEGGKGGEDLANRVLEAMDKQENNFEYLYNENLAIKEKIEIIAKEIYGADGVDYTEACEASIDRINREGYDKMPICMAKTQKSISDNPKLLGRPSGFNITVKEINVSAGAGFLVALTGDIMTMPGLPKVPSAENIDIDDKGNITGLF